MNNLSFFQFYLHIPVALFEDLNDEQILENCVEAEFYPIVIIRDKNHFLFIKFSKDFKKKGIEKELKLIILGIGYNIPYLS